MKNGTHGKNKTPDNSEIRIDRYCVESDSIVLEKDPIGVEEPLQISLLQGQESQVFTMTMRTPGSDKELIYGLLFSEGIIQKADDIIQLNRLSSDEGQQDNLQEAEISEKCQLELPKLNRRLTSYSGCGLCGKTSLQALELKQSREFKRVESKLSVSLAKKLKFLLAEQPLFSETGGVHAAGLVYENDGQLDMESSPFFEDVGRHNALDKLIGHELLSNDLKQSGILVLSGRIGFELVQKAVMAGFSVIVALGAPSSLAIKAANQFDLMLVGFTKNHRFNLYTSHKDNVTLKGN